MEWRQRFYLAAISSSTVQFSPETFGSTCQRDRSLPAYLSSSQISITTTSATPPTDFYPTTACARYEVIVRKLS